MRIIEKVRHWPGNTIFPADPYFGFTRDDFTLRTWIHRFTHKPGRSFWARIIDTLSTDITTAGVNKSQPRAASVQPPSPAPSAYTHTPPSMGSSSLTLLFFVPGTLSSQQLIVEPDLLGSICHVNNALCCLKTKCDILNIKLFCSPFIPPHNFNIIPDILTDIKKRHQTIITLNVHPVHLSLLVHVKCWNHALKILAVHMSVIYKQTLFFPPHVGPFPLCGWMVIMRVPASSYF